MKTNTLKFEGTVGMDIEDALVEMRRMSHKHYIRVDTLWNEVPLSIGPCATLAEITKVAEYYRLQLR